MSIVKRSLYILLAGLAIAFFAIFLLSPKEAETLDNMQKPIDNPDILHSGADLFIGPKLPDAGEMRTRAPKNEIKKPAQKKQPAKTDEDPGGKVTNYFPPDKSVDTNPWPEVPKFTPEEIQVMIKNTALEIGFNPDIALRIAKCESKFNHMVISKTGKYWGVYQYDLKTWKNTSAGKAGKSRLDARAMISTAILHMKVHGTGAWPNC